MSKTVPLCERIAYSVNEAAAAVGTRRQVIADEIRRKNLAAFRIGSHYHIPRAALETWMANRVESEEPVPVR